MEGSDIDCICSIIPTFSGGYENNRDRFLRIDGVRPRFELRTFRIQVRSDIA